jgi:hypothetical protein
MRIYQFAEVRANDRVTVAMRDGSTKTGRAQPLLCNPSAGTIVLNMGGPYGTPHVCTPENFLVAYREA